MIAPESRDITWGKEAPGFDEDVRYLGAAFRHVGEHPRHRLRARRAGRAIRRRRLCADHGPRLRRSFNHLIILAGGGLIEPIRRKGKPKIFIAQGVKDTTMPPDVSGRKNAAQLKKEDYDVTYREHEGGHGTPPEIMREALMWFLGQGRQSRNRCIDGRSAFHVRSLPRPTPRNHGHSRRRAIRSPLHRRVADRRQRPPVRAIVDGQSAAAGTRRSSTIRSA